MREQRELRTNHFLEVDQTVFQIGLVALVRKSHVLEEERHEGDYGRFHFGDENAISSVVARRINLRLELREGSL